MKIRTVAGRLAATAAVALLGLAPVLAASPAHAAATTGGKVLAAGVVAQDTPGQCVVTTVLRAVPDPNSAVVGLCPEGFAVTASCFVDTASGRWYYVINEFNEVGYLPTEAVQLEDPGSLGAC